MEDNAPIQGEIPAQPAEAPVEEVTQESSSTPDAEAQSEDPVEAKAKAIAKDIAQKRIDQLTWKAHDAERRLNAELQARMDAESRVRQYETQMQELVRRATAPTLEQYNMDPDAYQRALQAHYEQADNQRRQSEYMRAQQEQQVMAQARFQQHMAARVAEGVQKFPDFEDVVNNPSLPQLSAINPAVLSAILDHEQFAELAYFMGRNPAEAHRIAAMQPTKAVLEVGKLAAKLASQPAQQSKAPPPPSQVTGTTATANRSLHNTSNLDDWMALRRKQIAARR